MKEDSNNHKLHGIEKVTDIVGQEFHFRADDSDALSLPVIGKDQQFWAMTLTSLDVESGKVSMTARRWQDKEYVKVPLDSLTRADWDEITSKLPELKYNRRHYRPKGFIPSETEDIRDAVSALQNKVFNPVFFEKSKGENGLDYYAFRYGSAAYGVYPEAKATKEGYHKIVMVKNGESSNRFLSDAAWKPFKRVLDSQIFRQEQIGKAYGEGAKAARHEEEMRFRSDITAGKVKDGDIRQAFVDILSGSPKPFDDSFLDSMSTARYQETSQKDYSQEYWQKFKYADGFIRQVRDDFKKYKELQETPSRENADINAVRKMFPALSDFGKEPVYYIQTAYIDSGDDMQCICDLQESEKYGEILDEASQRNDPDGEWNLADTFKRPDPYPYDILLVQDDYNAVSMNTHTGAFSFYTVVKESALRDELERRGIPDAVGFTDISESRAYSKDVKALIMRMVAEKEEKKVADRLGDGFKWYAKEPADAIEIGDHYTEDRITGIDVSRGKITLHGSTATYGGPDSHEIPVTALTEEDWKTLGSFADNIMGVDAKAKEPEYVGIRQTWDVMGRLWAVKDNPIVIAAGMNEQSAEMYARKNKDYYESQGYTLFTRPRNVVDRGRLRDFVAQTPRRQEQMMNIAFGEELDKLEKNSHEESRDNRHRIQEGFFVPDKDPARSLMLSTKMQNEKYTVPLFFTVDEINDRGLFVDRNAEPFAVPTHDGGMEEVYNADLTNYKEAALEYNEDGDPTLLKKYNSEVSWAVSERTDAIEEGQLEFVNGELQGVIRSGILKGQPRNATVVGEFLESVRDDYKELMPEIKAGREITAAFDRHIEDRDVSFGAYSVNGPADRSELVLSFEDRDGDTPEAFIHPDGSGTIHYDGADKSVDFERKKSWYDFAQSVYESQGQEMSPERDKKDKQEEDRSKGLGL